MPNPLDHERVRALVNAYDRAREQGHPFPPAYEREMLRFRNWWVDALEADPVLIELHPSDIEITADAVELPPDGATTPEQEARDLMEQCGVEDAQAMTAGDVGPLANRLAQEVLPPSLEAHERAAIIRAIELYRRCRKHRI